MNEHEQAILQTLVELDGAVKGMAATGSKPDLLPCFARLDELERQLPPDADPELKHFLRRKSYEKARQRLEGKAAEAGACRRS